MKLGARTFGAALVYLWLSGFGAIQAQEKSSPKLSNAPETQYKNTSAQKRANAKKLLAELIKSTDPKHPDMPELLFRYGEVCFEDARAQLKIIVALDEKIFTAKQAKDEAILDKLNKQREEAQTLTKANRLEAFKSYKQVVDGYMTFAKRDQVLFHLGYNLMEFSQELYLESELLRDSGKIADADTINEKSVRYRNIGLDYYRGIIKEYPSSVFMPDALLALGQEYFDQNDLASAQKVFAKIVEGYPENNAYGYALYLLGWCEYNNQNFPESIKRWVEVINYSRTGKGVSLEKEATRDIPKAYAQFGEAKKAKSFFQKIAGADTYQPMLKRLGELYKEQGQFKSAIVVYQELILLDPKSDTNYLYQYEIAKATLALTAEGTPRSEVVAQLQTLSKMYQALQAQKADTAKIADAGELTSQFLQEISTSWDAECFKTKATGCEESVKPLYEQYLKNFPEAKNFYEMSWNYAELSFRMAKEAPTYWEQAGFAYLAVLEKDPKGEHTKDAALGMAESFKMSAEQNKKNKRVAVALSENELRKVKAFTLGVQLDPTGVASSYLIAATGYLYWLHQMDKEAIPYFKRMVDERPSDPITADANRYLLFSLSALNYKEELLKYAEKTTYFDEEMTAAALPVYFEQCQQQYDAGQGAAGDCFAKLLDKFPLLSEESKVATIFNAAKGYEQSKQMGLAVQYRSRIIREHPKHEKAQSSLYTLGMIYAGIGSYTKAAETLEQFAEKYPDATEATSALNDAAIYREGLDEYDKAKEDNKKFLALATKKKESPSSIAETSFRAVKLVERAEDNKKTALAYEEYLKAHAANGTIDNQLVAKTWLAANAFKTNKKEEAYTRCDEVLKAVTSLREDQKILSAGLDAAAECQFYLAEKGYAAFESLQLPSPFDLTTFGVWFSNTKRTREETSALYLKVTQYNSKQWSLAALARIGVMSYNLGKRLEKLPIPQKVMIDGKETRLSSLSKADQEVFIDAYEGAISELIEPLYQDARASLEICIEASTKTSFFNEWSSTCEEYLNKMDPSVYPIASEWQVSPNQEFSAVTPASLVTKLK
jgi:cellulose synthase operon protein C